jgi:hypothetical protein
MSSEHLLDTARRSDLFFFAPHYYYDALTANKEPAEYPVLDEVLAALYKDAEIFCERYGGDPTWYVRDFLRRL